MASSLHYVTPLQLSDTFNEWFLRSNSLIDVVNKINVYNVDTGFGLAKYRSIDGTTLIRLNIGGEENEYDGSGGVSADWDYGLKFVEDPGSTGAGNPDVSTNRRILTLDFDNLPGPSGGISGASITEMDMFAFADSTDPQDRVKRVSAANMLPYGISGDHRFYGNIYFDGTNTVINSSELAIDDKLIYLATSNTGDESMGYLNDVLLDGAGIVIRGASGDKEFTYEYTQVAGGNTYHAFKTNIDLMFGSSTRGLVEDNSLDFFSLVNDDFDVSFSQVSSEDKLWKIRKSKVGDAQGRLIFFFENTTSGSTYDALTLSKAGTVKIGNLEGGTTLDGVFHESSFSYLPASYSVPTTGVTGDTTLHFKWANRKTINQLAHGFSSGQLLRQYPMGTTYTWASDDSKENAEVIAIVEDHAPGASHDQFVAVFAGLVDMSNWNPADSAVAKTSGAAGGWTFSDGTTMNKGQVYFLSAPGTSGGITAAPPDTTGMIKKPVLLATDEREALFVNYLGHEVSTGDVESGTTGNYVFTDSSSQYLILNAGIPNQGYKNKIINGDFSFWQRSEYGGSSGSVASGASNIEGAGTTGARFHNEDSKIQYTCDMWALDTRLGTLAEVRKMGHTAGATPINTNYYTSEPRGSYVRVLNNSLGAVTSKVSMFSHKIENVNTFAPVSGLNQATVSYWAKGVSAASLATWPMRVSLWQVYDGDTGGAVMDATGDYRGGATMCLGVEVSQGQYLGVTSATGGQIALGTEWAKQTHTYLIPDATTMTGDKGPIDPNYNWLELRFEIPTEWGVSGGVDLARVQLESGMNDTDWEERTIQEEEQLVNRYYQRHAVGLRGYATEGSTMGYIQPWHTTPYPSYGHTPHNVDLSSKCVFARDIVTPSNTNIAQTSNIRGATAGMGFEWGRTAAATLMTSAQTNYHFDFSIYDGS